MEGINEEMDENIFFLILTTEMIIKQKIESKTTWE